MSDKSHWEKIYAAKGPDQVSWYQVRPQVSLDLIRQIAADRTAPIIDVGGGMSTLVDFLLQDGFQHVSVLDVSSTALATTRARLGPLAYRVTWIDADITNCELLPLHYDIWHDRAVFHFLTTVEDRQSYVEAARESLKPGGHLIVASFAIDGPTQCSGLDVMRYSPSSLRHEFGEGFDLIASRDETHVTPFGTQQKFIYCHCRKRFN